MTPERAAWQGAIDEGLAIAARQAGAFGHHAEVHLETSSTSDDAARLAAAGADEGTVVVAAAQTAGRGRRGTAWYSPAGHGLYFSLVLRPDTWPSVRAAAAPAASLITLMAGVAVARAVHDEADVRVELKWPNDVMLRRPGHSTWRKMAGILAEGVTHGAALHSVIVGIGINVSRSSASPELQGTMISIEEAAGRQVPIAPLLAALLSALRTGRDQLAHGAGDVVRSQWASWSPTSMGTRVRWQEHDRGSRIADRGSDGGGERWEEADRGSRIADRGSDVGGERWRHGTTASIDASGALLVQTGAGLVPIVSGTLQWELDVEVTR